MGFKKLRLFPVTTESGIDGYPEYGQPIRLQGTGNEEDFNSINIKLTEIKKTKTLNADDKEKIKERITGYDVELEVYRVEAEAAELIHGHAADANGNLKEIVNGAKKKFGLFFEGKTSDELKYQKYLYLVEFTGSDFEASTDTGENTGTLKLTGKGYLITEVSGAEVKAYTVYHGNPDWLDNTPTAMYKGPSEV